MRLPRAKLFRLGFMALLLGTILFVVTKNDIRAEPPKSPTTHHCVCRHNAQQKKDVANFGVFSRIQWKKINLNGGIVSYHRVASIQLNPWRYVEIGWMRSVTGECGNVAINNYCGFIVYNAGGPDLGHAFAITRAAHNYQVQYDPNTMKHWFYLDGANVWNVSAGFGQGTQVKGGGEVGTGVEQMKDIQLSNLLYSIQNGGVFQLQPWNGYVDAEQEAPYSTIDGGPNDFFNHGP